jgi:hypothetical protein
MLSRGTGAAVILLAACGEPEGVLHEGEIVAVVADDGVELCAGTLAFYDRFAAVNYETWTGAPAPADLALTLELRGVDRDDALNGYANFDDALAWSENQSATLHELAHLVVGAQDGGSAAALMEGIAEAFGASGPLALWAPVYYAPQEFLFEAAPRLDVKYYAPAAQLLSFLIRRYGIEVVREAYVAASGAQTEAEVREAIAAVVPDDLDAVFGDYAASTPCPAQLWECEPGVLATAELPIVVEPEPGCEDPDSLGATHPDGAWFPYRQYIVDVGDLSRVEVDVSEGAAVYFEPCVETCEGMPDLWVAVFQPFMGFDKFDWDAPPPGRYVVTIRPDGISNDTFGASLVGVP